MANCLTVGSITCLLKSRNTASSTQGQLCTTLFLKTTFHGEGKKGSQTCFQTAVQNFVFATFFIKQHQIQENRNKVLDFSSVIYCECHQAVDVCNSRGFGHVTKTTNLISWPAFVMF